MQRLKNLNRNLFRNSIFQRQQAFKSGKIGVQALLSGILVFGNYYKFYNKNEYCVQNASKVKYTPLNSSLVFETFTDQAYNQALKDKYDVIVVVEPDRFRDEFVEEIKEFLEKFKEFQKIVKGRPVKIFKTSFSSKKDMTEFQDKYNVRIERDTILLLKNRYLEAFYGFGSYDWFENREYVFKYYKKITKLNNKNYDGFLKNLNELSSENVVLLAYGDKSDKDYKQYTQKFGKVSLLKEYSDNNQVHMMFVNDNKIAKELGLKESGGLYIMQKTSKFNYKQSNTELKGIKFHIQKSSDLKQGLFRLVDDNSKTFQNNNIFSSQSFDVEDTNYSIVLETNENRLSKQDSNRLINVMGEFKKALENNKDVSKDVKIQFVKLNRNNKQRKYTIYVRDDVKSMDKARAHSMTDIEDVKKLNLDTKPHSYAFNYPDDGELTGAKLVEWFQQVKDKKAEEFFKSQDVPFYRKYSRKLVGKSFKEEVLENPIDQAVFFYSKNCHACRQYGELYEEFGFNCKKEGKNIDFNRMNSDFNTLDCSENFPYTPVFQVFKRGAKDTPYVYRSDKFTPKLLEDFILITTDFQLISEQTFDKIFENYEKPTFVEA